MKLKTLIILLTLFLSLSVVGLALAQNGVERPWWVLGGGASNSTASGVTLRATLGQPMVGGVTGGDSDVILAQGFWYGGEQRYNIYLPLVMRHDQP